MKKRYVAILATLLIICGIGINTKSVYSNFVFNGENIFTLVPSRDVEVDNYGVRQSPGLIDLNVIAPGGQTPYEFATSFYTKQTEEPQNIFLTCSYRRRSYQRIYDNTEILTIYGQYVYENFTEDTYKYVNKAYAEVYNDWFDTTDYPTFAGVIAELAYDENWRTFYLDHCDLTMVDIAPLIYLYTGQLSEYVTPEALMYLVEIIEEDEGASDINPLIGRDDREYYIDDSILGKTIQLMTSERKNDWMAVSSYKHDEDEELVGPSVDFIANHGYADYSNKDVQKILKYTMVNTAGSNISPFWHTSEHKVRLVRDCKLYTPKRDEGELITGYVDSGKILPKGSTCIVEFMDAKTVGKEKWLFYEIKDEGIILTDIWMDEDGSLFYPYHESEKLKEYLLKDYKDYLNTVDLDEYSYTKADEKYIEKLDQYTSARNAYLFEEASD